MTAALDDVRPIGDPPAEVIVAVRWQWCGSRPRLGRSVAQAKALDIGGDWVAYGCPFGAGRRHWHAGPLTDVELVMVAAVARAPQVDGPHRDPRPYHTGQWCVSDPATGRILETCPPPSSPSSSPAGAPASSSTAP